jgi:hypothetical protein
VATQNKKFLVKNGLSIGGATGILDVIDAQGNWTGPNGIGSTGAQGAQGLTGATGVQGIQGNEGIQGIQGASGSTGLTGIDGASGSTGLTGSSGVQGASGSTGLTGSTGITGASGIGATGFTGATGLQGPVGQSSTFYDYKAKTSTQSGDPGNGFIIWNNATLTSSTQVSISHITDNVIDVDLWLSVLNQGDVFTIQESNDSSRFQKWQISGTPVVQTGYYQFPVTLITSGGTALGNNNPIILALVYTPTDGATGVQGASGSTGLAGATGTNGSTGAAGTNGSTGAAGTNGSTGADGTNGSTGPQGIQGASGSTGAQGIQGNQGVQGASGSTGPTGSTGPGGSTGIIGASGVQGASGSTGVFGATGSTGPQGIQGASGSSGIFGATGSTGPAAINGSTGAAGSTGPAGINGTTGPSGINGSTGPAGSNATISLTTGSTGVLPIVLAGSTGPFTAGYATTGLTYNPATTVFSAPFVVASGAVGSSGAAGAYSYGTMNYSDGNILASFSSSVNSYNQMVLQNTNSGAAASTNFIVSNDLATASTNYGEFGMNSSTFSGASLFSTAGIVYLASQSTDIAIGTFGAKSIFFTTNDSTTAHMSINSTGNTRVNNSFQVGTGATGATGSINASGAISAASASFTAALPIASGGTNSTATPTLGGVSYGTGTALAYTAAGTAGQALVSNGGAAPTWQELTLMSLPGAWVKKAVDCATTAALTLNTAQASIDGVALSSTSRVLVKDQAAPAQNGIYTALTTTSWVRAVDADTAGEIAGAMVNIDAGTVNGGLTYDTDFKTTNILGTDALTWNRVIDTGYTIPASQGGTGQTTLTLNNVVLGNGTSAVQFVAPGANGNVLTSNGTTWTSTAPAAGGGLTTTDDNSTNASYYPVTVTAAGGSTARTSSTKLYFNPSTGTLNATVFNSLSDVTFKENIVKLDTAVDTIKQLDGVSYNWKDTGNKSYGVIAQDIEKVLPELISTNETGIKSVNYNGIIAFLINAIKEQQAEIDDINRKLNNLN